MTKTTANTLISSISAQIPHFNSLQLQDIEPCIREIIQENEQLLDAITSTPTADWQHVVAPLIAAETKLSNAWSLVSHLNAVCSTPALRDIHDQCLSLLTEYYTKANQHAGLYKAYQTLRNSSDFEHLNLSQQKVITNTLRDFELSGVNLAENKKERYQAISQRLSQIESEFEHHVMDATDNWHYHTTSLEELSGIPAQQLQQFQQNALDHQLTGWRIGLDYPSYQAVITYCDNEVLRHKLYRAYTTRASELGKNAQWDNSAVMVEILQLRHEIAQLLGFKNYVDYALVTRMAKSVQEVNGFLLQLINNIKPIAEREWQCLCAFAANLGKTQLEPWDVAYYSEKMRVATFDFSDEELRAYFPAPKVMQGLFTIIEQLFVIKIKAKAAEGLWHKDALFFELQNPTSKAIGYLYCDLYPRAQKRGGAWMADCRSRYLWPEGSQQLPVAFVTANLTAPQQNQPALLSHDEVTTLFHEMGHALHHLLTCIDYPDINGISGVAWDAVELPSQWLEQWCWQKDALPQISAHVTAGAPLPNDLLHKALAAKNFQSALFLMRQLEFALFDMTIYQQAADIHSPLDIARLLQQVRAKVSVVPVADFNRFAHSFGHIFAGGYAAGYYSYLWAEVLSCDVFSVFAKAGIFDKATGQRFLDCFLSQGGVKDAATLVKDFLGREPDNRAFLEYHGIV